MNSAIACLSCFSLKKIIRSKHSDLIDRTKRSAWGERFGLLGGSLIVSTPVALRMLAKPPVNNGLRSWIKYACRAGTTTRFSFGDDDAKLGDYAWLFKNVLEEGARGLYAHPGGQKKPNAWGLYDMHGNVFEWCSDLYGTSYYYFRGNATDPAGPSTGVFRVQRGGSFIISVNWSCRSARRFRELPSHRASDDGFRVVVEAPSAKD